VIKNIQGQKRQTQVLYEYKKTQRLAVTGFILRKNFSE